MFSKKLNARYYGPFSVLEQTSPVTFRLELPEAVNIHPIFHVGLLKPYYGNESDSKPLPKPDKEGEYEIEKILGHRKRRDGKYRYLVKWRGYSYEESTWEPSSNFKSKTLQAYHRERKERKANESGSSSDDEPTGKTLAVAIGVGAEEAALARHRASVENLPNRDPNRVVAKPSTVETPGETLGETLAHMESSSNSRPGEIGNKRSNKRKASSPENGTRARAHACMSADARDVDQIFYFLK